MADVLKFWSKSADKKPGKGAGESVKDPARYDGLAEIPDWRKVLSNFHVCPFRYNGRTYRTIEHAFQATKIGLQDPSAAERFTVESGTDLGARGDGLAARKERKMVMLSGGRLTAWNLFSGEVMSRIAQAKYDQCAEARRVLRATMDAQLWHVVPRSSPVRFTHLEHIRSGL